MESRFTHAVLTLSKFGDSIQIRVFSKSATDEDNIYPLLKKGLECNGCEQILVFLKEIQKDSDCLKYVYFAHRNNPHYPAHMFYPPENPHEDSLESMIAFVEDRILNPEIPPIPYSRRLGAAVVDSAVEIGCKIL